MRRTGISWRRLARRGAVVALILANLPPGAAVAGGDGCLEGATEVRAAEVVDARSLRLSDGRVLRAAGIEPFDLLVPNLEGAEAAVRQRLLELADGRPLRVQLVAGEVDRYGRHPAMIAAADGLIQESLAREGLVVAFASGDALPCFERILAAEAAARAAGRGFWDGTPLPEATPQSLGALVGHFAVFEGTVRSVGNRSTRTYLNFGARWSQDVTVEIAAADREAFGGEAALAALAGHSVRLRGFLEAKAGPMMAIRSPMQLEVLGASLEEIRSEP